MNDEVEVIGTNGIAHFSNKGGDKDALYTSFEDAVHGIEVAETMIESCATGAEVNLTR